MTGMEAMRTHNKTLRLMIASRDEAIDRLLADNLRLKEQLRESRAREDMRSVVKKWLEDQGLPLRGAVQDGKVSWRGIDTRPDSD